MPWDYRPWGCGTGVKGSCNDGWIQFEICEDGLTDKVYFEQIYKEACEITAYLCKMYNIDPKGTVMHNNVEVPTILCHADSHALGLGSNHGDINHWFPKFGKSMETARKDVAELLNIKPVITPIEPTDEPVSFEIGDEVRVIPGSKYSSGGNIPAWVQASKLYVREIKSNGRVVVSIYKTGRITGTVYAKDLIEYESVEIAPSFTPYLVRVTVPKLNVRAGDGLKYKVNTVVSQHDIYTIIAERNGWGKLKSGAGWIDLQYTKKV